MSAHALLAEIRNAGIKVEARGERLHVEAKPGTLTEDLRARLAANKAALLDALHDQSHVQPLPVGARMATIGHMRKELLRLAELEGIDLTHVERMEDADVLTYAQVPDFTEQNYRAHVRALAASADMDACKVPAIWRDTQAATCDGCGPVLLALGAPDRVGNCLWCFMRRAGKAIPRPTVER